MKESVFKSAEARDRLRGYYKNVLDHFPFGQEYVDTAFGKTFMLTAGKAQNPPVILLHGSCSNSAFWFPEIMALSPLCRVYAVDIIGEAGNSGEYRPDLGSDAFALWIKEVLFSLGLEKAVIIGNSLGGWIALKFAAAYPKMVSKLVLIASSGLAEIKPQFLRDVEKARKEDGTVPASPAIIGEESIPKEVLDFMNLIIESYNPIQSLPVFEDKELKELSMPVLFIDGKKDAIIDAEKSAKRLSFIVPSAEIHLLCDCGHMVLGAIDYILPFLARES